jgi:hypothetical protein
LPARLGQRYPPRQRERFQQCFKHADARNAEV